MARRLIDAAPAAQLQAALDCADTDAADQVSEQFDHEPQLRRRYGDTLAARTRTVLGFIDAPTRIALPLGRAGAAPPNRETRLRPSGRWARSLPLLRRSPDSD